MKRVIIGLALLSLVGCASGPGVTMDPFTPDEVNIVVNGLTETYLMKNPISPVKAQRAATYLQAAQGSIASGTIDLMKLRVELTTNVPEEWRPLANASWVILLKRVHIEQLIADGQYQKAREYLNAAIEGALTALQSRV